MDSVKKQEGNVEFFRLYSLLCRIAYEVQTKVILVSSPFVIWEYLPTSNLFKLQELLPPYQNSPGFKVFMEAKQVTQEEQKGDDKGADRDVHDPSLQQREIHRGSCYKDPNPAAKDLSGWKMLKCKWLSLNFFIFQIGLVSDLCLYLFIWLIGWFIHFIKM